MTLKPALKTALFMIIGFQLMFIALPSDGTAVDGELSIKESPEYEAKLLLEKPERVLRYLREKGELAGMKLEFAGNRLYVDTYFDTEDFLLLRSGMLLRMREKPDGKAALQFKRPGKWIGNVLLRREAGQAVVADDLELQRLREGWGLENHGIIEELYSTLPKLRSHELKPVIKVVDHRETIFFGPVQEPRRYLITIDTGTFETPNGSRTAPFAELEMELIGEDTVAARRGVDQLADMLVNVLGLERSIACKYERASLRLHGMSKPAGY